MTTALLLIPRHVEEERVVKVRDQLEPDTVRTTSEEYDRRFFDAGSWDAWTSLLAKGKHFVTQQPLFDKIYCLHSELGRANASIVGKALHVGKPVHYIDMSGQQRTVVSVELSDPDDWVSGWSIIYT